MFLESILKSKKDELITSDRANFLLNNSDYNLTKELMFFMALNNKESLAQVTKKLETGLEHGIKEA